MPTYKYNRQENVILQKFSIAEEQKIVNMVAKCSTSRKYTVTEPRVERLPISRLLLQL